jgi:hypothetical protein
LTITGKETLDQLYLLVTSHHGPLTDAAAGNELSAGNSVKFAPIDTCCTGLRIPEPMCGTGLRESSTENSCLAHRDGIVAISLDVDALLKDLSEVGLSEVCRCRGYRQQDCGYQKCFHFAVSCLSCRAP